ncbi:hypothetical protein ACFWPH_11480 [Nocardia sp. NPDC058499]|uniref:hypothetical protein n=1 Tax=Nocardia sp. NPDC058499 TaxID=3346530 RepID=UPI003666F45F
MTGTPRDLVHINWQHAELGAGEQLRVKAYAAGGDRRGKTRCAGSGTVAVCRDNSES